MAQRYNQQSPSLPGDKVIQAFIAKDDPKSLIETADLYGKWLASREVALTTSQLRNLFGAVRQIQMGWQNDPAGSYRQAVLLIPKFHYQAKRTLEKGGRGKLGLQELERALLPALEAAIETSDKTEQQIRFNRVTEYFEALVAYHKKHGGKDK